MLLFVYNCFLRRRKGLSTTQIYVECSHTLIVALSHDADTGMRLLQQEVTKLVCDYHAHRVLYIPRRELRVRRRNTVEPVIVD